MVTELKCVSYCDTKLTTLEQCGLRKSDLFASIAIQAVTLICGIRFKSMIYLMSAYQDGDMQDFKIILLKCSQRNAPVHIPCKNKEGLYKLQLLLNRFI